ncbi:ABC transporter permease [Knoellia aerolata]|uniref:ABC transporter n=1 Tax=Knoellia aerolata DSM 18566 TaxID=1385519 RepID=A0A0A0JYE8_9MICO|nr:ABC transporter permease [Knoellia aerolata]KGN42475.1 ABC transporter [Knoellia aerolata DSM 18566]
MTATTMTSPDRRPGPGRATPELGTTRREARSRGERTAYVRLELRRTVRDLVTMFFVVGLPAFMYVLFGASAGYSQENAGNGNVALYVMISMAAYGAVTATVGIGGTAAVERMQGWGRQLGLTPLRDGTYVATKAVVALVVAALPILVVYVLGVLTGAEGTATAWLGSAAILVVGAVMFALYGLVFGLAFRSESAVTAAGGSLVVLGFLGNIFFPLSGILLDIARFTPLYGYVSLARYPLTEGHVVDSQGGLVHEALWMSVTNVAVWTGIFAVLATWLVRRSRGRQ